MITLVRYIRLVQLRVKWKLALYQYLDKQMMEIIKHPEEIEKKIMPYLAELIHTQAVNSRENKSV